MLPVILINRPLIRNLGFHVSRRKWQPLNLLYIGTWLKNHGIPVKIIDARAMDYSSEDIAKILLWKKPEIILIASDPFDFYQCPNPSMVTFYKCIKAASLAGAKYILSIGPQATVFDKKLLQNTGLNYIIKGDDPLTAAKLIRDLVLGKNEINYENVSYNARNNLHFGRTKHLENLDELPVGNYDLLPMHKYSANMKTFPPGKFVIMSSSRGCPYQCKYCFKELIGNRVRKMSLKRIEQELDILVKKHRIQCIYFLDDFFTFDFQRVNQICQLIIDKKYNLSWGCQTRPDMVNEDLLRAMKAAGCIYISYGVESGSQKILDQAKKNLNLEYAQKMIGVTRKLGIHAHINTMYGFPGETATDFSQTINFMLKNKETELPGAIRFYPGCTFYNELIPGKTVEEVEKISLDLLLSKLKRADIDRGLAKLILFKKIHNREFDGKMFYYLFKFLFPKAINKLKKYHE